MYKKRSLWSKLGHMSNAVWVACCVVPLLTGCLTHKALMAVDQPTTRSIYDRIDHIDRVVLDEDTLLLFLEGRLANSPSKSKFTVSIPLAAFFSNNIAFYQEVREFPAYARLMVSRDVITPGWALETLPDKDSFAIPIGPSHSQDGYPDNYPWERPVMYSEFVKPLPNTKRTLYPLSLYDIATSKASGNLAMEFVYVDPNLKQAYTVIYVDQVGLTKDKHRGYYCLLPLTVAADIVTLPVQAIFFAFVIHQLSVHGM